MDKKKLNKILLIASQVFFGLFIVLIILLLTVDRKEVGPDDAVIGLSTINVNIFSKLGFNPNSDVLFQHKDDSFQRFYD